MILEPGVEVFALRWYNPPYGPVIGFVGLIDRNAADPFFKVYIGTAGGDDVDDDTARIARRGHPLLDEVLARHLVGEHYAFAGLRYEF